MKRSELKKKREEEAKAAKKNPKPSAAERTGDLFGGDENKTQISAVEMRVTCEQCDYVNELVELSLRPDGDFECSKCAAPIELSEGQRVKARAHWGAEKKKDEPKSEEKPKKGGEIAYDKSSSRVDVKQPKQDDMRPTLYCGECAAALTESMVDGKVRTEFPCGHERAGAVMSPLDAANINPPRGTERMPQRDGFRVRVPWGESMFRLGEFATFRVGGTMFEFTVHPGTSVTDAVRQARREMKKLADEEFEEKLAWYRDKLGLMKG